MKLYNLHTVYLDDNGNLEASWLGGVYTDKNAAHAIASQESEYYANSSVHHDHVQWQVECWDTLSGINGGKLQDITVYRQGKLVDYVEF